jgi:hypothetical protein
LDLFTPVYRADKSELDRENLFFELKFVAEIKHLDIVQNSEFALWMMVDDRLSSS